MLSVVFVAMTPLYSGTSILIIKIATDATRARERKKIDAYGSRSPTVNFARSITTACISMITIKIFIIDLSFISQLC